jgi:hypothetical protein
MLEKFKLFLAALAVAMLTGCAATEKWAEGIATKNISGNGTFVKSSIGIDPDSRIPGVHTTFVSGDLATAKSGSNSVTYREEVAASTWNANAITRKRFLAITLTDSGRVDDAIRAVSDVLRSVPASNTSPASGPAADAPAAPSAPE